MEFKPFQKIARLSRDVIITEKLDGTNASIVITPDNGTDTERGTVTASTGGFLLRAGSRNRWITPDADNMGFAAWVYRNCEALKWLGEGAHYGEWWGKGIQRNYSLTEKRFSLFNVSRWADDSVRPACCHVVPTLYSGPLEDHGVMKGVRAALADLEKNGSKAAPGFMKPEGIVVFHTQGGMLFKKTFEKDDAGKGREPLAEAA